MSEEQSIPESVTHLYQRVAKKIAPFVMAGLTAFTPDAKASPTPVVNQPPISPVAAEPAQSPGQEQTQEAKEALKDLPQNTIVIDMAPTEQKGGINQTVFPNENLIASANIPQDVKDYLANRFDSHGESVAFAMRKALEKYGFTNTITIYPLQNMLNPQKIETTQDELGNHKYFFSIDPNKLAEVLSQYSDQKVVNLSLQLGKVGIERTEREKRIGDFELPPGGYIDEYGDLTLFGEAGIKVTENGNKPMTTDGKVLEPISKAEYEALRKQKEEEATEIVPLKTPNISTIGAYSKEDVEQNLPQLFKLCKTFPDKLFVAAAGNEGENLEGMTDRPANLLLIAQWNGQTNNPQHGVLGADIYVGNSALGLKDGSSFSTPVIAALGSIFASQGLNVEEIKTRIQEATDEVIFTVNGEQRQAQVLNPDKITPKS